MLRTVSPVRLRLSERLGAFGLRAIALWAGLSLLGCTPDIGDKCVLSTDCSVRGDRLCDTSQPNGYCTQFNCSGNNCPEDSSCVLFNSAVPGCPFNDRGGPNGSRTARSFCTKQCESDSDCRTDEGYVCASPTDPRWAGRILDNDQSKKVCLVLPPEIPIGPPPPPVLVVPYPFGGPAQTVGALGGSAFDAGVEAGANTGVVDAGASDASVCDPVGPNIGAIDAGKAPVFDGGRGSANASDGG